MTANTNVWKYQRLKLSIIVKSIIEATIIIIETLIIVEGNNNLNYRLLKLLITETIND